jgi:glycosyltransferase involved in cell wall biosynthesis
MPKLIHYHSDCPFFAGCESMLVNFWSSPALRSQFDVSFSYHDTQRYTEGLMQRAKPDFPVYPLRFPDPYVLAAVPERWPYPLRRGAQVISSLLSSLPILAYEIWVLYKLFARLRPDILHVNNGSYPAALSARAATIAAKLAGVPQVVMVVNNLADDYRRPSRWKGYPLDRLVVRSVNKFVTGSVAAASQLEKVLRLDERQCLPIQNGIALRQATETREETRKRLGLEKFDGVIYGVVALMIPRKGHRVLLESMAKLLGTACANNIKILIEGDGPLRGDLQAFVADSRLSDHCVFIGDEKNVMNFMALLDVLVLPSVDEEDFPNVILEAMGMGKPVIASRLAGTPEQVVDGETGLLVAPRDVDQLAAAISRLGLDGQLRMQMGQAGLRRFQERFTAEVAVRNYVSLYQSLIEA